MKMLITVGNILSTILWRVLKISIARNDANNQRDSIWK